MVGLLAALLACGDASTPVSTAPHILYIGNSLTYANDLPDIVAALARADGQPAPIYASVTYADYSLGDHWDNGAAPNAIRSSHWDYVVMQQGPSSLDESRAQLILDVERFAPLIQAAGGRPALFSVWPESARFNVFDRVDTSYAQAAAAVGGLLLPAGEAWQAAWRRDSSLALYGPDGFHPSLMGSYLAALVIYARIYQRSPLGFGSHVAVNSADVGAIDLAPGVAEILEAAAAEAEAGAPTTPGVSPSGP